MDNHLILQQLPIDTVIILGTFFLCFPVAIWFNTYRQPSHDSLYTRGNVSAALGILVVVVCFRWNSLHLFLQWMMSYILLTKLPRQKLGKYTFVMAYSHVLIANAYKFIYQYGDNSVDFTGTLMLGTMKLTSLAFAIEDSSKPKDKLTDLQRKHVVEGSVTLQEHFNYYFSFVGILFGPFIFYGDYKKFINNTSKEPKSNIKLASSTLVSGLGILIFLLYAMPRYPVTLNYDETVLDSGFLYKHQILYVTMFVAKCKYYFVWLTAQSLSLYAGYDADEDNESISATVNPLQIELATSLKQFIDNWNIFTAKWLRYTCFERVAKHKALVTFVVSAIWHGFYPGYLMMFIPLAFYTILGQKLHKVVWPVFQRTQSLRVFYTVITWFGATITVCFNGTGFQLLYFYKILQVQLGLYCYPHIIALLLFVFIPSPRRVKPTSTTGRDNTVTSTTNNNGHYLGKSRDNGIQDRIHAD